MIETVPRGAQLSNHQICDIITTKSGHLTLHLRPALLQEMLPVKGFRQNLARMRKLAKHWDQAPRTQLSTAGGWFTISPPPPLLIRWEGRSPGEASFK